MKKIAVYGAGGFGKEVACIIKLINEKKSKWDLLGFFDDEKSVGTEISHFGKVIGNLNDLNSWHESINIVFALGNPAVLRGLVTKLTNKKIDFPNIIHPDAFFADRISLNLGKGNVIVRGCSFSVDVDVGDFNQFNSFSALAHDVKVGSFNIFMPMTRVSGEVRIGSFNLFAIGTVILQKIKIGNRVKIAPSSVVMRKTKDDCFYMGNPAKKTIL
jgi:sugar O-acyltransferase (sialic acid O-acetyltransferase NeuD family)